MNVDLVSTLIATEAAVALAAERQPKRRRSAAGCVAELRDLRDLLDVGAVTQAEFADLKARLLNGE